MTSARQKEGILPRVEAILLLAGCAATGLAVDGACLQPFRDEKESLFIWFAGLLALLAAYRFLSGRSEGKTVNPSLLLIPVVGIAFWRLYESWGTRAAFGFVEPGLPVQTDYLLRYLAYALAGFFFWMSASRQRLTSRNTAFIGAAILLLGTIFVLGAAIEIVGDRFGYDWRPFLLGAFLETGQGTLKANYFGGIGNSNFLAGYAAILSFAVVGFALASKQVLLKMVGTLLFVGMFSIVVLCRSKGAFAGFALGSLCLCGTHLAIVLRRPDGNGRFSKWVGGTLAVFATLAILAAALAFSSPKRREDFIQVARLRGESLSQRILLGYVGLEMWRENPWFGIGPGEFRLGFLDRMAGMLKGETGEAFATRVERLKSFKPVHVHNDYLEILIEWGVVGYLSCAAFLAANLGLAWRSIRTSAGVVYGLRLGAMAGVCAALGYALFEFPFFLPSHFALVSILLGLSVAPPDAVGPAKPTNLMKRLLVIGPVLGLAVFLLWHGTARSLASGLAGGATRLLGGEPADRNLAVRNIHRAARLDPGYADLNRLEALVAWRVENRPDLAVRALRRGAPISDDPLFELMEAEIHLEENRPREAAQSLSPLLAVAPFLPGVGYLEGRIQESQGDLDKAKEAYARDVCATRSRPEIRHLDLPHLYLRYGSVLERLGLYREAVWQYEEIADLESDRPLALFRLGRLYRDRFQDLPTAEGYFERAMDSAQKSGNPAEEELARKEILELKKMREQMRKDAVLIEDAGSEETPQSNQKE
jgi:O-antigen ligase